MSDIPTSGAISLNQMHTEVGGASGAQVSLNDPDIRGLIGKASGATMSFSEWYGASASTSYTLGQGSNGSGTVGFASGSYGSLSPTTFDGVTVRSIGVLTLVIKGGSTSYTLIVTINGSRSQNFFTSIQNTGIGTLQTSAASHSSSSSYSSWSWSLGSNPSGWDGSGNLTVTIA
jgi:hypothetical protein